MKTLFVMCADLNTLKICEKYSDEGLVLQDEEFKGDLNFHEKEDILDFLEDIEEGTPGYLDYCEDELSDIIEYFKI